MKILQIAHSYPPQRDGVANVVESLSRGFVALGHEAAVLTHGDGPASEVATLDGVRVVRVPMKPAVALKSACEAELDRGYDACIVHCLHTPLSDLYREEKWQAKTRSVLVTHGLHFDMANNGDYLRAWAAAIPLFHRWVTIAPDADETKLAQEFGLPKALFIPNGVHFADFEGARKNGGARRLKKVALSVGNHAHCKGHRELFEVAQDCRDFEFRIVGRSFPAGKWGLGSMGVKGGCYYECCARSLLHPNVRLLTKLARRNVLEMFGAAAVLISTSNREANSLVLIEACAAGLPWISFDVGSARHVVGGVIARDAADVGRLLRELAAVEKRWVELSEAGIEFARQLDWSTITKRYIEALGA
jgi:glycosyltransferase involved in cell wall biosynthesis